ncbi:hypothetical protein K491DRAFT_784713 [Lophiostoma macrostomum CBS 122681]|uniref:Uncharacterized protein n=1 Tax=Lophiostoma macrostomum CBS 122681 TaxID=1314788 RepID=A0A6A6SKG2_9PLEO|nr:hypothetical protein K491DRAFT_784713 [Lophiostoma macrostomum CBS 122681]
MSFFGPTLCWVGIMIFLFVLAVLALAAIPILSCVLESTNIFIFYEEEEVEEIQEDLQDREGHHTHPKTLRVPIIYKESDDSKQAEQTFTQEKLPSSSWPSPYPCTSLPSFLVITHKTRPRTKPSSTPKSTPTPSGNPQTHTHTERDIHTHAPHLIMSEILYILFTILCTFLSQAWELALDYILLDMVARRNFNPLSLYTLLVVMLASIGTLILLRIIPQLLNSLMTGSSTSDAELKFRRYRSDRKVHDAEWKRLWEDSDFEAKFDSVVAEHGFQWPMRDKLGVWLIGLKGREVGAITGSGSEACIEKHESLGVVNEGDPMSTE